MRSLVVVDGAEPVEECLELGEVLGGGLLVEPAFEGLLESFDLPAGGGMVRSAVLLDDAESSEFGFERVASAAPAGEACGEDHAVVRQR